MKYLNDIIIFFVTLLMMTKCIKIKIKMCNYIGILDSIFCNILLDKIKIEYGIDYLILHERATSDLNCTTGTDYYNIFVNIIVRALRNKL